MNITEQQQHESLTRLNAGSVDLVFHLPEVTLTERCSVEEMWLHLGPVQLFIYRTIDPV